MAVTLSNKNTGAAGLQQCIYGCCGFVTNPKNKHIIRKALRSKDTQKLVKARKGGDYDSL